MNLQNNYGCNFNSPQSPTLLGGNSLNGPNLLDKWQSNNNFNSENQQLERAARFHRNSARVYDATCTWSGVLPERKLKPTAYSSKVFLGGVPWDVSEQALIQTFKQFGPMKVEWPGKDKAANQPKGYVYIIFESEKNVRALLHACNNNNTQQTQQTQHPSTTHMTKMKAIEPPCNSINQHAIATNMAVGRSNALVPASPNAFYKMSSRRLRCKEVEVIPWSLSDSNFSRSSSQKLDPSRTVFVGALHGMLNAEGLARIMNDLFDGVVYAGIDTDKYRYPIGSGRVTFNNSRSYMKAVSAAFVEIKTPKFTKKVQIDPYLEDALCSICGVQQGPYFCRDILCFRYFCRVCWTYQHDYQNRQHSPLMRNPKNATIMGLGICTSPRYMKHNHNNNTPPPIFPNLNRSWRRLE
jgi:cytoplasmic polyadenylation element-binding protein